MSGQADNDMGNAFARAVRSLTRGHNIVDGIVKDVDETKFTADITVNGTTFFEAPLRVLVGSQASVIEIPTVGTRVLLAFRDGSIQRPQILMVHQVDKLLIKCNEVIFNDGQLGGMVKVMDLTTKLNNLEKDLNLIKQVFIAWSPVTGDGGAALKAAAATWAAQQLSLTQRTDLENAKIKQ